MTTQTITINKFDSESKTFGVTPSIDVNTGDIVNIYVANDKLQYTNTLYKNNGDGTFTDVSEASGTDIAIDAMSVTIDDFDYDGWMDKLENREGLFLHLSICQLHDGSALI